MNKKFTTIILVMILFIGFQIAFAEEIENNDQPVTGGGFTNERITNTINGKEKTTPNSPIKNNNIKEEQKKLIEPLGENTPPKAPLKNNIEERKKTLLDTYREKIQTLNQKRLPQQFGSTTATTTNSLNNRIEEKRAEMEAKREEVKARLDEKRKEQVKKSIENIVARFEKTIEQLTKLQNTVQERINFLQEKEFDMTKPKALIQEIPAKIEVAKNKIIEMEASLAEILNSDDPKKALIDSKPITDETRNSIKEIHSSLVNVIESMKASVRSTATSTSTTTQNQ